MKRFTDNWIKSIKATGKVFEVREGDGFLLRVSPTGTKTFYYIYTDAGKRQRIRIGEYGVISLAEARAEAGNLFKAYKRGENLKQEKTGTVELLAAKYLAEHAKPNNTERTYKEVVRIMDRDILPDLGSRDLDSIKRRDIHTLIQKIVDRQAPSLAHKALKVVRRMFNYGIECGITEVNPAHMIKLPAEREKTRVLSDDEISAFFYDPITSKASRHTMNCLKLILVTAQRPGECLGLLHEEIDEDWWTIPKAKTKNQNVAHAQDHRVYLSPLAKSLINGKSGKVFPVPVSVSALSLALRRLFDSKRIKSLPFTPHDLRRTAATHMAELGISQETIDRVLGHTSGKISRTYNRYAYDTEKQEALTAWANKIESLKK